MVQQVPPTSSQSHPSPLPHPQPPGPAAALGSLAGRGHPLPSLAPPLPAPSPPRPVHSGPSTRSTRSTPTHKQHPLTTTPVKPSSPEALLATECPQSFAIPLLRPSGLKPPTLSYYLPDAARSPTPTSRLCIPKDPSESGHLTHTHTSHPDPENPNFYSLEGTPKEGRIWGAAWSQHLPQPLSSLS